MESISSDLDPNKTLLAAEIVNERADGHSATAQTIPSDLTLAAPAPPDVAKGESPELVSRYWMYDKSSSEYEGLKADFQRALKLSGNAADKNEVRDGLELMRSSPALFRGFPAGDYHELLRKSCDRGESRLSRLMEFSAITGSDSQWPMRREIFYELDYSLRYEDRPEMREILARDLKRSLDECFRTMRGVDEDSLRKFVFGLLTDIIEIRRHQRLNALMKYCEIIPDKIKEIPQSDLQELPEILALNGADASEAIKCLGKATGYVFLPHGILVGWKEIPSLNPDIPEDQRKRTDFADELRQRIDKIVGDGRDANLVLREVVLKLAHMDEETQSAGVKLLCEFFKNDLSSMFAASGDRKSLGIIASYCDKARSEFDEISEEINDRLRSNGQMGLQESFKDSVQERVRDYSNWSRNRDRYLREIGFDLRSLLYGKSDDEKRAAGIDVLLGFSEWADGYEKLLCLQDFARILSADHRGTIVDIVGENAAKEWLLGNFPVSNRDFEFARMQLGLDEKETAPEEVGEEFVIPYNPSERVKWAERELMSICNRGMNGSGTAFQMHSSFNNMSWQDRADAMQLTVNWTMQPLNSDTLKKLKAMAASVDLRGLMANTVTKRKFAEVKDENLRSYMQQRNMVRSN